MARIGCRRLRVLLPARLTGPPSCVGGVDLQSARSPVVDVYQRDQSLFRNRVSRRVVCVCERGGRLVVGVAGRCSRWASSAAVRVKIVRVKQLTDISRPETRLAHLRGDEEGQREGDRKRRRHVCHPPPPSPPPLLPRHSLCRRGKCGADSEAVRRSVALVGGTWAGPATRRVVSWLD